MSLSSFGTRNFSGWLRSPAKINLFLNITNTLPNGYHQLQSHIVPVALYDTICCLYYPVPSSMLTIHVNVPNNHTLSMHKNLIYQVATQYLASINITHGYLQITLFKNIPQESGLGGASSNAATVLRWLNDTVNPHPWNTEKLISWCISYGADIPFFIHGHSAMVEGIGDIICDHPPPLHPWLVLAKPSISCKTQQIYQAWDQLKHKATCRNHLYPAAISLYPYLETVKNELEDISQTKAIMSGSGSCFYMQFSSFENALSCYKKLNATQPDWWYRVTTIRE